MALVVDAATRKEVNDLKLKLRALGIDLDAIKWSLEAVYWNPMGFDFTTVDWRRVQHAADVSPKLGLDSTDMPGYDAWRNGAVVSVGYTQIGKPPYVHLDVAINRPGLCRVYTRRHGDTLVREGGLAVSAATAYSRDPAVRKVVRTLMMLRLPLQNYGIRITRVYNRPEPEGFDFDVEEPEALLKAAAALPPLARDDTADPQGKVSAAVTLGQGYREVGYGPRIHLEVAKNGKGNVHIDLEGWVVGKDQFGRAIYDWVHGISHHFPEDLLPGFVHRPLVGAWRGIEWRPSVGVEHGRAPGDDRSQWRAKFGFLITF
jgi:hypothetical protein